MSRPWLRLYSEFVTDPKVQLLAFEDQRHYICLLCLKCNGTLDSVAPSGEYHNKMISKALGLDMTSALEARRRLVEVGLVGLDWQPTKWDERQYESDRCDPTAAARMRRHRERKKGGVTSLQRHVTAADQNRSDTDQNPEGERAPVDKSTARSPGVEPTRTNKAAATVAMQRISARFARGGGV